MPTVDKREILDLFSDFKTQLVHDDLFSRKGEIAIMERYMARLPTSFESFFAETLKNGSESYRYAAVLFAGEVMRHYEVVRSYIELGNLVARQGESRFFGGNLEVRGNLALEDQAIVVVAGDLFVEGNVVGAEWDYSMLGVAGSMRCRSLMTKGELLVGQTVAIRDHAYLYRKGCSALAPAFKARVLVQNHRLDSFLEVTAEQRVAEPLTEEQKERLGRVCDLLGLHQVDDAAALETALRSRLLSDRLGSS